MSNAAVPKVSSVQATAYRTVVQHLTCNVPHAVGGFTYKYTVRTSWVGHRGSVIDVTVNDAQGGHVLYYFFADVIHPGLDTFRALYPRTPTYKLTVNSPYVTATKANPIRVHLVLKSVVSGGGAGAECITDPVFWG
jgi:hypothetical protein